MKQSEDPPPVNGPGNPAKVILPIKETQARMLEALLKKIGWSEEEFRQQAGKGVAELTSFEARKWIGWLNTQTRGKPDQSKLRSKL